MARFVAIRPDASYADRLSEIWHDFAIVGKIWQDLAKLASIWLDLTKYAMMWGFCDILLDPQASGGIWDGFHIYGDLGRYGATFHDSELFTRHVADFGELEGDFG